ncbi:MAG: DUF362 domain-containing protein [bacterium]
MKLGLDPENIGTSQWNPFKDIVKQGDNVLIKPNLVTHRHYLGDNFLYSTITHGSMLRPIIDYVYLALDGKGSIIIADNPIQRADFNVLMEFTGIQKMADELTKRGYNGITILDLRPRILHENNNSDCCYEDSEGDPLGYVTIDLGKDSLFAEFDENPDIHYYTLADPTVDHINPKYIGKSATDDYHNQATHRYIISKTILNADVIINVAKMKSHCKAGMSLTLKNMVGMVYEKNCMPHHRPGPPPMGDSFPYYPASHYVFARKSYTKLKKCIQLHKLPGIKSLRDWLQKKGVLVGQHIEHGNWKGNDTIWRTILDLNRIAIYADKEGRMQDIPQRHNFGLIDGIISQQGAAPMNGDAVTTSMIFGGFNPVCVDALAIKYVGLDCNSFKFISKGSSIKRWKLIKDNGYDFSGSNIGPPSLEFKLPKGWN